MSDLFDEIEDYPTHPEDELNDKFKQGLIAGMRSGAETIYEAIANPSEEMQRRYSAFLSSVDGWAKHQVKMQAKPTREPHKTKKMRPPGYDHDVDIDIGIADLIAALWERHFATWSCCEENEPGAMVITFLFGGHADDFIELCADLVDARWQIAGAISHLGGPTLLVHVTFPREKYTAILDKVRHSRDGREFPAIPAKVEQVLKQTVASWWTRGREQ